MGKRRPKKSEEKEKGTGDDVETGEKPSIEMEGTSSDAVESKGSKATPIAKSPAQIELPVEGEGQTSKASWGDEVETTEKAMTETNPKPKNWVEAVTGNRDTSNGWILEYQPLLKNTTVVTITPEESAEACANWRNSVLGFVVGAKPRFREMEWYARTRWGGPGAVTVHLVREGIFLFDFVEETQKDMVLGGNWSFRGQPLNLRQWAPGIDLEKLEVTKVPVWIQFPHLPLSCWSSKILGKIASPIGVPLATDMLTAKRGRICYARVLVEMEIKDALIYEVPVSDMGRDFMQPVVYEWEPLRCGRCKQIGHDALNCRLPTKQVWVTKTGGTQTQEAPALVINTTPKGSEVTEAVKEGEEEQRPGKKVVVAPAPEKIVERKEVNVVQTRRNQIQKKTNSQMAAQYSNQKQKPKNNEKIQGKGQQSKGGSQGQGETAVTKSPNVLIDGNQVTVYLPPNG